jgi:prolyl-tRNA synthetase
MRERWKKHFSEWYNEVIEKAEILDIRYPVKGLYVWFPYGFSIRRHVLDVIRRYLNEKNHKEALFPLLIPEDEFAKEAKHIHGFEDEVYWVTHGGLQELNIKLALRPTSETSIYPMFAVWIRSHRDMPLKIYQVVNTFRYETKHTRPLIRLREITTFKEAHTAHSTWEDAEAQVEEALEIYKRFFDALGVPYTISRRPDWDKFPGAEYTMAFDTIFPDGRTLQIGTVHNLGQNFSRTFEITFENLMGEQEHAYQTCYGISDRVIAALLAIHGDDAGLCLIPEVAPIQAVIVPIWFKGKQEEINDEVEKLEKELSPIRVKVDNRELRPGSKFYDWEIKGVPLRLELGPRDIAEKAVTAVRRDNGEKLRLKRDSVREEVKALLHEITRDLRTRAWRVFKARVKEVEGVEEARKQLQEKGGIVRMKWCAGEECAAAIEEATGVSILGIIGEDVQGRCAQCGAPSKALIQLGRTY